MSKIALVDLDGVLNNYIGNYSENNIPSIKNGAKEFLEELSKFYDIEIFTIRNKLKTIEWLRANNIIHLIKDVTNVKNQHATIIIDDRALKFIGDFEMTLKEAKNFRPYWKNN